MDKQVGGWKPLGIVIHHICFEAKVPEFETWFFSSTCVTKTMYLILLTSSFLTCKLAKVVAFHRVMKGIGQQLLVSHFD